MNYFKAGISISVALIASGHILFAADKKEKPAAKTQRPAVQSDNDAVAANPPSMTLEDAVRLALKQNPQVREAIQLIEQTKGQIITVRAEALPNVTATGVYNQDAPKLVTPPTNSNSGGSASNGGPGLQQKTWNVSVQATQQIYSPAVGAA